jgi:glucan 1,3-beta-glucosidase
VLQNITLRNCPHAVAVKDGSVVLSGGDCTISRWGQGHVFTGTEPEPKFVVGDLPGAPIARELLDDHGRVWTKARPQYEEWDVSKVVSVKEKGAKGDGVTV